MKSREKIPWEDKVLLIKKLFNVLHTQYIISQLSAQLSDESQICLLNMLEKDILWCLNYARMVPAGTILYICEDRNLHSVPTKFVFASACHNMRCCFPRPAVIYAATILESEKRRRVTNGRSRGYRPRLFLFPACSTREIVPQNCSRVLAYKAKGITSVPGGAIERAKMH